MHRDQPEDQVEPEFMKITRQFGGVVGHEVVEWAGFDPVGILCHQTEADLRAEQGEQSQHAPPAKRVVADHRGMVRIAQAAQVGKDRAGTAHEPGKARGRASDEAPQQAEHQQREHDLAQRLVQVELAGLGAGPQGDDQSDEAPVDQPHGQVP